MALLGTKEKALVVPWFDSPLKGMWRDSKGEFIEEMERDLVGTLWEEILKGNNILNVNIKIYILKEEIKFVKNKKYKKEKKSSLP